MKTGDKFNLLECISEPFFEMVDKKTGGKQKVWKAMFRCDCGTEKIIRCDAVRKQSTKSCGCLNRKLASDRAGKLSDLGLWKNSLEA